MLGLHGSSAGSLILRTCEFNLSLVELAELQICSEYGSIYKNRRDYAEREVQLARPIDIISSRALITSISEDAQEPCCFKRKLV
jgi:hypothetical protein